jgi:hypothetical protein
MGTWEKSRLAFSPRHLGEKCLEMLRYSRLGKIGKNHRQWSKRKAQNFTVGVISGEFCYGEISGKEWPWKRVFFFERHGVAP